MRPLPSPPTDVHRVLRRAFRACLAAALAAVGHVATAQTGPQPKLPTVTLNAGLHSITAEVAATDHQRQMGLMLRKEMAPHEGMLFRFDDIAIHCFWMKDTLLPLSIAFVAEDGTIVGLADMPARSLESHCPPKPVRYALEMNQGWFAKRGIKPGARLSGPPFTRN